MTEHRWENEQRCECPPCVKERKESAKEQLRVREAQRARHREARERRFRFRWRRAPRPIVKARAADVEATSDG